MRVDQEGGREDKRGGEESQQRKKVCLIKTTARRRGEEKETSQHVPIKKGFGASQGSQKGEKYETKQERNGV